MPPAIVHALSPSRIKRSPKPAQALPTRVSYSPKRRAPPLPTVAAEPTPPPFDRDARADAADALWRELVRKVEEEGGS